MVTKLWKHAAGFMLLAIALGCHHVRCDSCTAGEVNHGQSR
jgi:hypothetical protein